MKVTIKSICCPACGAAVKTDGKTAECERGHEVSLTGWHKNMQKEIDAVVEWLNGLD